MKRSRVGNKDVIEALYRVPLNRNISNHRYTVILNLDANKLGNIGGDIIRKERFAETEL